MAVPSPLLAEKRSLRAEALRRRRAFAADLPAAQRVELEDALARLVLPHVEKAGIVASYVAMDEEIGTGPILAALRPGQRNALPWFAERDSPMLWREGPAVELGFSGIPQPAATSDALDPDVILVPLVLADRRGTRIGFGKGHYDRALAGRLAKGHAMTIGIAWEIQISAVPLPAEPWDVRLDAIATPKEFIRCV